MNYNKMNKKELINLLKELEDNTNGTLKGVQEEKETLKGGVSDNGFTSTELKVTAMEHLEILRIIEKAVK